MASLWKAMQGVVCGQLVVSLLALMTSAKPVEETREEFRMPGVQPTVPDTYLCLPRPMGEEAEYITGFVPHANMSTAHHILLYGCTEPGETDKVWSCGEMEDQEGGYEQGPVCKEGSKILYAWAMDAPQLHLPKDVAFKVGGDTDVKWLVLQVHYKDVSSFIPPNHNKDDSGLTLISSKTPLPKRAGVYLLGTDGELPPNSTIYMETACGFDDPIEIHPFAFRTHAHTHGEVTSGYRIRDGQWEEIGRMSPQRPQMFYNVTHPGMTVKPGDILAARCTMTSHDDHTIFIGSTQNDEMCNFYIMYWVDGDEIMNENYCFSDGPPHWYWSDAEVIHAENVPGDASTIPGTDKVIKATEHLFQSARKEVDDASEDMRDEFGDIFQQLQTKFDEPEDQVYQPAFDLEEEFEGQNEISPELLKILAAQYQYYPSADDDELENYYNRLSRY